MVEHLLSGMEFNDYRTSLFKKDIKWCDESNGVEHFNREIIAPHKNLWVHLGYRRTEQVEDSKILLGLFGLLFPTESRVDIQERWRSLFFGSKAPGLVFSTTYLRGKLAPSAVLPLLRSASQGFPHT